MSCYPVSSSLLDASRYEGYAYAYPHKTAYRPLTPVVSLEEAWQQEKKDALFGYVHIPFCENRCGYCNLLSTARPSDDTVKAYLASVERQAHATMVALGDVSFAQFAIGGGTPTYLVEKQLERLFSILQNMGINSRQIAGSVETSPSTATPERIGLLKEKGIHRVSLGIQTFCDREAEDLGRRQSRSVVDTALETIRSAGFPFMNIDLIYGGGGQTIESWIQSVRLAIEAGADEIYLYPLYVRPKTGLWKRQRDWDDQRLSAYRAGRDLLLEQGFTQVSMRLFRKGSPGKYTDHEYSCQRDGMVGLGCGARSYTRTLHYASKYAVGHESIQAILEEYIQTGEDAFGVLSHGFRLDRQEQIRRFIIKSILRLPGLDCRMYETEFNSKPLEDCPQLQELMDLGLAEYSNETIRLTETGLERSDSIGPWLYSDRVQALARGHKWH